MLKEQFTQTLLTLDDIESLLHGLVPQKVLLVDFNPCGVSLDVTDFPANEPCDVAQGTTDGTESFVESIRFENTTDMHMFNIHSTCDTKLFGQSKNKINAMKEVEKPVKLICKRAKLQANKTKDNINRLQQSKSDIGVTKNRSSQRHCHTGGKRKGHKTKSKILFRDYKTAETSEGKCNKESNKEQDQDVSNFRCSYCSRQCVSKKSLQKHIRNHEKDKEYSCEKCGKKCLHLNGLCLHSQTHTEERPFKCAACGKAFLSSSALRRHQLVHMRGRDTVVLSDVEAANVCPSCGKAFSQKGNLTVHMKIHFGRYDHVCKTCQKQFITSGDLKRHERVHSREKPYTCDSCQKSFTTSSTLVCHMRSHSGERPYLCGVCGATFAILSHLKQHNKIHARGDLWPRRKGASATGENIRRKTLHGVKQADKDNNAGNTLDNESKQKKDSNTNGKDMSLVANSLQLPDLPYVDLVDSSIQHSSNSLFINSVFPSTVYSIQSPRGIYVGEKVREIKLISDAGNDVQMVEVTSSSHNAVLETEESEINIEIQSVISQRDTAAINVQCPPSADSSITSRTFIKLSDVINPSNNGPFKCCIAESTVSLYNPKESSAIASENNISVCDRLNNHISSVMPVVQHISRSSNVEHIQTKDTLTVATHGIQYVISSFCEDKGFSNYPSIPSGVHNNISCAVEPARTTCSNAHALISSKKLDSTASLTFKTVEHEVNSLSFPTPVNVGRITSDDATAVLTNKVDSFDIIPPSVTSLRLNSFNSSSPASFLSSDIYIGHDRLGMIPDQSVSFIRSTPTSPCSISFPSSSSNVVTIITAGAVTEKNASIVDSDQQGRDCLKK